MQREEKPRFQQCSLRQIRVCTLRRKEAGKTQPEPTCQTEGWMSLWALIPAERCHHRFSPKTSGTPGACPANLGPSCRKPSVLGGAKSCATKSELISSTTALYGPIHLNQSGYLGNEPRWQILLRSNYPLRLLVASLPTFPQAPILLRVPRCSGGAPLPHFLYRGRPLKTEELCQQ